MELLRAELIRRIWKKIVALTSNISKGRIIVFIAANGTLIYLCSRIWYNSIKYNPWENLPIKLADRRFWYGSYKDNLKKPLHEVENERYRIFNQFVFYGYFQGAYPIISICKPNRTAIKMFGRKRIFPTGNTVLDPMFSYFETKRWQKARNKVEKVLHTENVMFRYAFEEVVNTMQDQVNIIKTNFCNGRPINVKKTFDAFAFDATCKIFLDSDYGTIRNPDEKLLKEIRRVLTSSDNFTQKLILKCHFPTISKLISLSTDEYLKSFKKEVYQIIEDKYFNETADCSLKWNALEARFNFGSSSFENRYRKAGNRLEDTTHQFLFSIIFGSHKVSTLATMACYLLARHENVQNTLREKIYEVIKQNKGEFQYSSLNDIEYLDCVINETLRLYPPVTRIERFTYNKMRIKKSSILIPNKTHVTVPICGIHMDPLLYENPEEFDPSRFLREPPLGSLFIPFGISPRNCIGETFARMVTKIILVYIVGSFTIAVCPLTKIPPKFGLGTQVYLSIEEMVLSLRNREDSPIELRRL